MMASATRSKRSRAVAGGAAACGLALALAGCFGTETTAFPAGLEPWQMTNLATPPAAMGTDAYPEQLSFFDTTWTAPMSTAHVPSVHARAYVQMPITAVWAAARDPQTGRDPTASQGFHILAYATEPDYQFSYRTEVHVDSFNLDWEVAWRHGVVSGTSAAPLVTATRWQKVAGTTALTVLEGSMVLRAVEGQPNVTEVQYQYHLQAPLSGTDTIEGYLTVIYGRLRDRAHNRTLDPNDCANCATPPAGY